MASGEPPRPRTSRAWLILGFSAAGILHLAVASHSTSINEIPLSAQLGILDLLPPTYWFGMGLLGLAVLLAIRERSDALVVLTGALLLATFAGMPSLFESNPRYWDAYTHFGEAQLILSSGHLPPDANQYSANWPGFFLVAAAFGAASGGPPMFLLTAYPFLTGALTFLALFAFLRSTFPRPVVAPAAVLTSLFAVWAQYHVSPQSLGLVLVLLVLAIAWRREARWRLTAGVIFLGLVVSHPTSTLLLLSILASMSLLGFVWARASPEARKHARFTRQVTAIYAAIWLAWLVFNATGSAQVAQTAVLTRIGELINLPENAVSLAHSRTGENVFTLAPRLRLASLGLYGLTSLVGLVLLRRKQESRQLSRFLFAAVVGPGFVAGADILGFGGQFYDRSLLFFAVFAPGLCLAGLRTIRLPKALGHTMTVALLGASVAAASTAYYQEAFYHVTDESVAIADFLQRVPAGAPVVDGMYPVAVWIDPASRTPLSRFAFYDMYPKPSSDFIGTTTGYTVFEPTAELWYLQWRGIDIYTYYQGEQAKHSVIYDNGRGTIVLRSG